MSDIAVLGIKVDASQVNAATAALDKMAPAAAKAERGADRLARQFKGVTDILARSEALQQQMAASLDKIAGSLGKTSTAATTAAASVGKTNAALTGTNAAATSAAKGLNAAAAAQAKLGESAGKARADMINMSRQMQDIAVSLGSGQGVFTVGLQQGAQALDILANSSKSAGQFFGDMARGAMSFVTPGRAMAVGVLAVGAATYAGYQYWKNYTLQLDDMSRIANVATGEMSKLQAAASFKGIDAADFNKAMISFSANVYQAQHGMGEMAVAFRANGMAAKDFNGSLDQAAELIARAKSDQQRLVLLQQMGLPATMEWVRLLSGGAQGLKEAKARAAEFSANDEMVAAARKFDEAWNTAWTNFGLNARSGFQKAMEFGTSFFDKMDGLAKKLGNSDFWKNFYSTPNAAAAGLTEVPMTGFNARFQASTSDGNTALADGLRRRADALRSGGTKDKDAILADISKLQQRIGLLGQMATVEQQVLGVTLSIQSARLNGVRISETEQAALEKLAREQANGVAQVKAQTDQYRVQAGAIGMSVGAAAEYTAVETKLAEARRNGQAVSAASEAALRAEAAQLRIVAQAAAELALNNQIKFEFDTVGLSDADKRIASILRQTKGDDWRRFMDGPQASALRFLDTMNSLSDMAGSFAKDFVNGLKNGESVLQSLQKAVANLGSKLIDIGLDTLIKQGMNAISSGLIDTAVMTAGATSAAGILTAAAQSLQASFVAGATQAASILGLSIPEAAAALPIAGAITGTEVATGGTVAGTQLALGGAAAGAALWGPQAVLACGAQKPVSAANDNKRAEQTSRNAA